MKDFTYRMIGGLLVSVVCFSIFAILMFITIILYNIWIWLFHWIGWGALVIVLIIPFIYFLGWLEEKYDLINKLLG